MEPLGFRLWFRNVIFNSSHVEGGVCEGCGRRVAFCGGVEVSKDHGIGTRFSRVLGNDELEPSSRGPPRGGDRGLPDFPLFVQTVGLYWAGPPSGPRTINAAKWGFLRQEK